ncbi:UNVERIFIED_CONTAM: hypothetical protein FKN15_021547 [Acipenser sinensis]
MAHSCRWRFPARPGGSTSANSGRRAARIRVTASLRTGTGAQANPNGLWPGFDAALQVSATIGNNLRKFRDVFGEASSSSSGEVPLSVLVPSLSILVISDKERKRRKMEGKET